MTLHAPTLLLCSVLAMAMSAALMALFGLSQRVYRGYAMWTVAQALAAAGLALHLFRDAHPGVVPLANLLVLQWPVLLLAGLRRFHQRHEVALSERIDGAVFAVGYLLWLAVWLTREDVTLRIAAYSFTAAVSMLYAAAVVGHLSGHTRGIGLKTMAGALLVTAALHAWRSVHSLSGAHDPASTQRLLLAGAVMAVLLALVMMYLALLLTCERTQDDLTDSQRRLRELANIDMLTQVPNRRHFHELAARTLAGAGHDGAALLMFDIDHFKGINDRHGHKAGDEALCEVATSLRHCLRHGDVAGRLGGDEFAALLPGTSLDDALAVAQRIVQPLASARPVPLGLSFGLVQVQPDETLPEALHRADQALYEAKRQGRNCAVVATGNDLEPVFGESRPLGLTPQ